MMDRESRLEAATALANKMKLAPEYRLLLPALIFVASERIGMSEQAIIQAAMTRSDVEDELRLLCEHVLSLME